jgi:diguanylate cyclase (GGDEF)-like protein
LAEISPTTIDTWIKFAHPDDLKLSYALLEKHFNHESDYYECETRMLHKSGDWIWVIDRGCVSSWTDDGKPLLMMGTHQDITQRKMAEETIKNLAFYDPLTQLPNRRLLQERVKHGINVCRRTGKQLAVFMLDLDKFKPVNDSLGHATGDVLLQQVALRIKNCVREVDMVARLGGDEFVILMEDIDGYENVTRIAKSIIENLTQPFLLGNNHVVQIGASIGICLYSEQSNSMEQLLDNADTALYTAKNQGRGCLVLYESVYDTDGISIK